MVQISEGTALDLQWWLTNCDWIRGRPLSLPQPDHAVVTDASILRWGGHLVEVEISGIWSAAESRLHINFLDLKAIRLTLNAFLPSIKGKLVQVFMNNTTAMWYYNKQGGLGSWTLCQEALSLWT